MSDKMYLPFLLSSSHITVTQPLLTTAEYILLAGVCLSISLGGSESFTKTVAEHICQIF